MKKWAVGAFTSIDAGFGVQLDVVKELGIPTIQLHAPHGDQQTPAVAKAFTRRLGDLNLELTAVFGGFHGESYESIPIVAETVGLVPRQSRELRVREMRNVSDFARLLECNVIALHLGFIPHDAQDSDYHELVAVTRDLCQYAAGNDQSIHLETGQETAEALLQFIEDTGANNLFVNFDPANMILYGTGQPIKALRKLGGVVRSVHCKDARWSADPGRVWGIEVPLGEGEVNITEFLKTLAEIGYEGPLTIEREIPQQPEKQKQEIGHAFRLLEQLKPQFMGN